MLMHALQIGDFLSIDGLLLQNVLHGCNRSGMLRKVPDIVIIGRLHGGYSLNRGLDELTLYEVYSAIDPEMFIIECLDPKYNCVRDGQGGLPCLVHRELLSVQDELISLLKRKTIQQIMEEA